MIVNLFALVLALAAALFSTAAFAQGNLQVAPVHSDSSAGDRAFWGMVKDSKNPIDIKAYLDQYPEGMFATTARAMQAASAAPTGPIETMARGTVFRDCADCPEMVVIPSGTFNMGSPASEAERVSDEGPQHPVTITKPFAAGKYEITRAEFARFVQESGHSTAGVCRFWNGAKWNDDSALDWRRPGFAQTANDPVTCVNWNDAQAYAAWLSRKTGKSYRLPSEAEWEYMARAETTTAFSFGNGITPQQANYSSTASYAGSPTAVSRIATAPAGSYAPNAFDLYDVHGNVWEWTEDCWNASYDGAPSDGSAWSAGDCGQRVLRSGAWINYPQNLRSASRDRNASGNRYYIFGLRLVRTD